MQVKLSPNAINKLQTIYDYISEYQSGAPAAYNKIDKARVQAVALIKNNPYCGRDLDKDGSQFIVMNDYVFCWIIDENEAIIFAIFGKGEDWRNVWT